MERSRELLQVPKRIPFWLFSAALVDKQKYFISPSLQLLWTMMWMLCTKLFRWSKHSTANKQFSEFSHCILNSLPLCVFIFHEKFPLPSSNFSHNFPIATGKWNAFQQQKSKNFISLSSRKIFYSSSPRFYSAQSTDDCCCWRWEETTKNYKFPLGNFVTV